MTKIEGSIRVLYVLGRMQQGGVEVRLLDVMRRLPRDEFRIDVCALSGLEGSLDADVRALGAEVIHLPLRSLDFAPRFAQLLRRNAYHVVHSNVHYMSGMVLALASRAGTPVRVANFHVTDDGRPSTLPRRALRLGMRRLIDRYATDIVGCCESVFDEAWSADWRSDPRCRTIYYGADLPELRYVEDRRSVRAEFHVPPDARLFLHLGRWSPDGQKNHTRLLSMFAHFRQVMPEAWLMLAGIGTDDPQGEIMRGISELGLGDRVLPLGVRRDIPRLLAAADVLLLPSLFEGLPNVVLEACAAGVPVLATDLGGVREIASRLPLVRYLPLSASDSHWAAVAAQLPMEAARAGLRDTAAAIFRSSPFHLSRAAEAHRRLWGSVAARMEPVCS